MAPIRKSAAPAASKVGPTRKPRVPRREQSDSWELLHRQRSASSAEDDDDDDEANAMALQLSTPPPEDVSESVELRLVAERVGKEVEVFAETIDKFYDDLAGIASGNDVEDRAERHEAAHELVVRFKELAEEAAAEVGGQASEDSKLLQEARDFTQEAETWELFRLVIELHHDPNAAGLAEQKQDRLAKMGSVHRYTSEHQLFDRFLLEDDLAMQRWKIKSWLENSAAQDGLMENLQEQAGNARSGWMHTREKIKGEKRLRTWPSPDSSPLPQLRSKDGELVATSLDPDAALRQDRSLMSEDAANERAMWQVVWAMLRRGAEWPDICEWCEGRQEGWRAVLLESGLAQPDAPANVAWRKMCTVASSARGIDDHEAAVYALLGGGNVQAVNAVSHGVDDQLFAHFSAALSQQFDHYLQANYPDRVPPAYRKAAVGSAANADQAQNEINDLIYSLRKKQDTKDEAALPLKIVQSYLFANETESFVHTLGSAIVETGMLTGNTGDLAERIKRSQFPEAGVLASPNGLRIAAHVCLVLQVIREDSLDPEDADVEDNIVEAYIQTLRASGKRDLTPLYASRLQIARYTKAQAKVLEDVKKASEMKQLLNLMVPRDMDVMAILEYQLSSLLQKLKGESKETPKFSMLEQSDHETLPGRGIKVNALPTEQSTDEERLVQSLAWYIQITGHWKETFSALTRAVRTALVHGRFALAHAIFAQYPSGAITERKSNEVLGQTFDFLSEDEAPTDLALRSRYNVMLRQVKVYMQLEQLIAALATMSDYRNAEAKYLDAEPRPISVPRPLTQAKDLVNDIMGTLLQSPFLVDSANEAEAVDFSVIRQVYLTEAIIAYVIILHSAARVISRGSLLRAMDVPIAVAKEELRLTVPFVDSGRMGELVELLARCAKALVVLQGSSKKKLVGGRDLGNRIGKEVSIWAVGAQRQAIEGREEMV
nr:hypothetical protein B0A51_11850 [Rachicladosporium sp. CCFEE 5018]